MKPAPADAPPQSALAILHAFKLRILRTLLILGSIFLAIIWGFESSAKLITPIDRYAYPIMIVIFLTNLIVLATRPQLLLLTEWISFGTFTGYVLSSFFQIIINIDPDITFYNIGTLAQWLPLTYIMAFMFFDTRQAMNASILVYMIILVATIARFFMGDFTTVQSNTSSILLNMLWAHPIYITALTGVSWLKTNFVEARSHASLMSAAANIDYLTSVANRRATTQAIEIALAAAQQPSATYSIMLIDIDHFKQINDQFGHNTGDLVLIRLATMLREQLRGDDFLGRWGGEEFIVIQRASIDEAAQIAERLRTHAAQNAMPHGAPITLSFGVSTARPDDTPESLVQRADEALYRAKERGRNRVERERES